MSKSEHDSEFIANYWKRQQAKYKKEADIKAAIEAFLKALKEIENVTILV